MKISKFLKIHPNPITFLSLQIDFQRPLMRKGESCEPSVTFHDLKWWVFCDEFKLLKFLRQDQAEEIKV